MTDTTFREGILELVNGLVGAELVDFGNTIFTKTFDVSDVTDFFEVRTGVREGHVIPIISDNPIYTAFPYKDPMSCDTPVCDLSIPFSAKVWQLGMIACKVPICINTFGEDFLLFWNMYRKVHQDESDINTALVQYLIEKFQKNLKAAIWRVAFFGDRSLTPTDPNYELLRPIDGIFTQAEAGDGIKIVIPANSSGALTGEEIYNLMEEAYLRASTQTDWFDGQNSEWIMTKAMATVFISWLNRLKDNSIYNCECFDADNVVKKRSFNINDRITVFGVTVNVRQELDGVIRALGLGNPYRALLTYKDNILIGTSMTDQLEDFDAWYERGDNTIYIRGGAALGASLVTDEYVYLGAETASDIFVQGITVTPAFLEVENGDTGNLNINVYPADATDKTFSYTVSPVNANVTVSPTGVVTVGTAEQVPSGNYTITFTSSQKPSVQTTAVVVVPA